MRSRTPLALMEQLVMVLVFALASAVCLKVFVNADQISRRNEAVSQAALQAQNTAEMLKLRGEDLSQALADSQWTKEGDSWCLGYDEDWEIVQSEESWCYLMEVREAAAAAEGLMCVEVRVVKAGREKGGKVAGKAAGETGEDVLFRIPVAWQEVDGHE